MRAKTVILKKVYNGFPKTDYFKVVEENLQPLKEGEFLTEAVYISVDPYLRLFSSDAHVGKPIAGRQVAKIIESKNLKYPVNQYVFGEFGWKTHAVCNEKSFSQIPPRILNNFGELPTSLALGVLGMPGNTAYFGFLKICKPKEGDIVVISGAGGAVGSHVGQIAKLKGCHVVGITGSNEKGKWLTDELGFDAYINYKDPDFEIKLAEATPNRVDCYFDNVGGQISSLVINRMNKFGRIAICGAISTYNSVDTDKATEVQTPIKIYHVRMEGFHVYRWKDEWDEGIEQNLKWIKEGKLKYRETITEGFENLSRAFIGMLSGENAGKAIVKV